MRKSTFLCMLMVLLTVSLAAMGCSNSSELRRSDPARSSAPTVDVNLATPGEVHRIPIEGIEVGAEEGDRIPAFNLGLADGTTISSAQLVDDGRPTFLFFFATT